MVNKMPHSWEAYDDIFVIRELTMVAFSVSVMVDVHFWVYAFCTSNLKLYKHRFVWVITGRTSIWLTVH